MMHVGTILAQTIYSDRIDGLRGAFNRNETTPRDTTSAFILLGSLLGALLILLIVRRIWEQQGAKKSHRRPMKLFGSALKEMGVGLPDRIMMRVIARLIELPQPTVMLFSPALLERHAGEYIDEITIPAIRNGARKRLEGIARKAFAEEGVS
jgi:hypothetical protein